MYRILAKKQIRIDRVTKERNIHSRLFRILRRCFFCRPHIQVQQDVAPQKLFSILFEKGHLPFSCELSLLEDLFLRTGCSMQANTRLLQNKDVFVDNRFFYYQEKLICQIQLTMSLKQNEASLYSSLLFHACPPNTALLKTLFLYNIVDHTYSYIKIFLS